MSRIVERAIQINMRFDIALSLFTEIELGRTC
jgi:hypothetical protein